MAAELLVRHVCDLAAAIERLRAAKRAWRELGPGGAVHEEWLLPAVR